MEPEQNQNQQEPSFDPFALQQSDSDSSTESYPDFPNFDFARELEKPAAEVAEEVLVQEEVRTEEKPKQSDSLQQFQNIFILDWDDTLFPTSFLHKCRWKIIDRYQQRVINKLDGFVRVFLQKLSVIPGLSYIYIITNAEDGWIKKTGTKFMPRTYKFMSKTSNIKHMSARSMFEASLPHDPLGWKKQAFLSILTEKGIKRELQTNLVCFGDSDHEFIAAENLSKQFSKVNSKAIRLTDDPYPANMVHEHLQLKSSFEEILRKKGKIEAYINKDKIQIRQM